jgi:ADP-ribosylglycohydrolase
MRRERAMRNSACGVALFVLIAAWVTTACGAGETAGMAGGAGVRTLAKAAYLEKVKGWWMGKIIGVVLGDPFEFKMPWPLTEVTFYSPALLQLGYFRDNDDLYVGMAYLLALEKYGVKVSQEEMAKEFTSRLEPQRLWGANNRAYINLMAGLHPPITGHPVFNEFSEAIDAQIENDMWGVVCPGMINTACEYANKGAHITNYANGAYGGIFIAAMCSGAFFKNDIQSLIEESLKVIPSESDYYKAIRDVINWHKENPDDWKATRQKIKLKWEDRLGHKETSALVNGASVVMALLYSNGDFDKTVTIATMAGWDTDCNAATAGGIIGIIRGARAIPAKWDIFNNRYRNESLRGIPAWLGISDLAARTAALGERVILARGGSVEEDRYIIPREEAVPPASIERPFPVDEGQKEEWALFSTERLVVDMRLWNPRLSITGCLADGSTGLVKEFQEKRYVFKTIPSSLGEPCILSMKDVQPPVDSEKVSLEVCVSSGDDRSNEWELSAIVNGKPLGNILIKREVPSQYRRSSIIPHKDEDIILYVSKDGSTFFDEKLTRLAQASERYEPGKRLEPLCIRTAQNNINLFKYGGKCPPGKAEIRSYFILTEWTDSPFRILYLTPGDPWPYGCYWPREYIPDLPLLPSKPIKLRIRAEEELPYIPEGGKFVLMHDENQATVISLPRIAANPSPWYKISYDLTPHLKQISRIDIKGGRAQNGRGEAYWGCVKIVRRTKDQRTAP